MTRSALLLLSVYLLASFVSAAHNPEDCLPEDCTYWNGPDCSDGYREECQYWIDLHGEPYFLQHKTNCSRFWLCEPSDFSGINLCLFECASCAPWPEVTSQCPDHALEFDWTIKYPTGPVCNWPAQINCTNKACPLPCQVPDANGVCHPECCVDADCRGDTPICDADTNTCVPGCRLDSECDNWDGICPTCQWCNKPDGADTGKCEPGCLLDAQCKDPTPVCQDHQCVPVECKYPCCIDQTDCRPAYDTECDVLNWDTSGPKCEYCNGNGHDEGTCTPGCIDSHDMCPEGYTCNGNHECQPDCQPPGCCTKGEDCNNYNTMCQIPATNPTSCEYCTAKGDGTDTGHCAPGCDPNNNMCPSGNEICDGATHDCKPGGGITIETIGVVTKKCEGCSQDPSNEGGAIVKVTSIKPDSECETRGLDHTNEQDYTNSHEATFSSSKDEDKHAMGSCYRGPLSVVPPTLRITWDGQETSKWSPDKIKITNSQLNEYECSPTTEVVLGKHEYVDVDCQLIF